MLPTPSPLYGAFLPIGQFWDMNIRYPENAKQCFFEPVLAISIDYAGG